MDKAKKVTVDYGLATVPGEKFLADMVDMASRGIVQEDEYCLTNEEMSLGVAYVDEGIRKRLEKSAKSHYARSFPIVTTMGAISESGVRNDLQNAAMYRAAIQVGENVGERTGFNWSVYAMLKNDEGNYQTFEEGTRVAPSDAPPPSKTRCWLVIW